MKISVVIIARNEAKVIGNTLQSLQQITDDIVVVDSGSTDDTIGICRKFNATVIETSWEGYGINKNKGIAVARHNWILSLDADEAIDAELSTALAGLSLDDELEVFNIRFRNFFCNKPIRFGEWGFDDHIRLFNRKQTHWNNSAVHESLVFPENVKVRKLQGHVLHYTVRSREEYAAKMANYAMMNAKKYFEAGKRPDLFRQYLSPVFAFLQHYIFRLGFLDGKEGFIIAKTTSFYTFSKYRYLHTLYKKSGTEKINL